MSDMTRATPHILRYGRVEEKGWRSRRTFCDMVGVEERLAVIRQHDKKSRRVWSCEIR